MRSIVTGTAAAAILLALASVSAVATHAATPTPAPSSSPSGGAYRAAVDISGCSGAVVRTAASRDDDPALVLTAGHCHAPTRPVPDEVLVDRPSQRLVNLLGPSGATVAQLYTDKALYVTMTGVDVAMYRLGVSYRQLRVDHGIEPLSLSSRRATAGDRIEIVSGSEQRTFACTVAAPVYRLLETGYVAADSIRYGSSCDTRAGTSGSPVISNGQVVAVNSTSNGGDTACTEDNPCEMDRTGRITGRKGASYGSLVHTAAGCFVAGSVLDLDAPGCRLPKPDPR